MTLAARIPSPWTLAADRLDPPIDWKAVPDVWVRERLREFPWSRQVDILRSIRDNRHTAVKSCHDTGKSYTAARAAAWWIDSHAPGEAFVVTTAPSFAQVKAILWREINRAHKKGNLIGRTNLTEWFVGKEMVAMGRKPAEYSSQAFQGIHQRYVLVIIDEACGVPKSLWDAVETLATNEYARVLAIGNPDDPATQFFNVCQPGSGWNVIQIGYEDTPAFTGEEVPPELLKDLISPIWVEERRKMWGEGSPLWTSKCEGEFPEYAFDTVVPLPKVRANQRAEWLLDDSDDIVHLGVDVGAGGDFTSIRERRGRTPGRVWRDHTADPANVVAKVIEAIRETGASKVKVDTIGIGWGVAGWLREKRDEGIHDAEIIDVNVAEAPLDPTRFPKLRDELWWSAREMTESRGWDLRSIDDDTLGQLIAPKYKGDTFGRTKVEKKEDTRARIGRSPDDADALLLAFYDPPVFVWTAA